MSRATNELLKKTEDVLRDVKVDASSPVPLHVQIRDSLAALMDEQALPPGSRLPTIRRLAASCGVAIRTAAQAMELLQCEGRVVSHVGRGVFVRKVYGSLIAVSLKVQSSPPE